MTVVRSDTFTRANVASGWGTATDGNTWTIVSGNGQSVSSNEGTITGSSASTFATLGAALSGADAEGLVRFRCGSTDTAGVLLRWTDSSNHWLARYNGSSAVVAMVKVGGTYTTLSPSVSLTPNGTNFYWLRFRVQGTTISLKVWQDGTSEPSSWSQQYTGQSSQNVAGAVGLYGFASGNETFDSFSVDDLVTNAALSGTLTPTDTLAGNLVGVNPVLSGTLTPTDTLAGAITNGTGIGGLAVTTKSQSWSGGPTGSPGTETDVTYTDSSNSGWSVGLIPSYGGMPITSWYEIDGGVTSANQTSLTTSVPDGHLHWLEQSSGGGVFAGSEDKPFTLTELAPTGTSFRRYYQTSFGPDANGFNWTGYACVYPGDPGFIAYRFDCTNPNGTAIALAGSDGMEMALIGGLQQSDTTWNPANGGYGQLSGADNVGWPASLRLFDPDYVYITPSAASGLNVGVATIKQKPVTSYSPAWANAQVQYLQNTARLKLKVQADFSSFPAATTSTIYLLNVLRRNLTATDVRAIASDYQHPGTPTTSVGTFLSFSYDERAYVYDATGQYLTTTLDLTAATLRYKPILKLTHWSSTATPIVTWGGTTQLTAGTDYQWTYDAGAGTLYLQLYFDIVPTGTTPTAGQLANAALSVTATVVPFAGTLTPTDTAAATLTAPAAALTGTVADTVTAAATLTPPAAALTGTLAEADTLAGTLTPPALALSGALAPTESAAAPTGLLPPATALTGAIPATDTAAATLTTPPAPLSGTLTPTETLAGALSGAPVALSGALVPTETLAGALAPIVSLSGTLTPSDTLAGALSLPPVALSGTLAVAETLVGALVTPDAVLSGALTPTETLVGTLAGAPVALAGILAASDTLAGSLVGAPVALAGAPTPADTVSGALVTPDAPLTGVVILTDVAAGSLTAPAATLTGTLSVLDTLVGALSGAPVALAGSLTLTETANATLTPPALALGGTLNASDVLVGALSALVAFSGTLAPTDTLAGAIILPLSGTLAPSDAANATLTPPALALGGTLAPTDSAAGVLVAFLALVGTLTPTDTLAGSISVGTRRNNEVMTTDNVLLALSVVLPRNTQQALQPGTIAINDDSPLTLDTGAWPALLIMEGPQDTQRINARLWQKRLTVFVFYLSKWGTSPESNDAIWADINADLERMIANLADNPTLFCVLPGAGAPTRNCLEVVSAEPSPRTQKVIDDRTYGAPVVQRMLTLKINLPPYIGLS